MNECVFTGKFVETPYIQVARSGTVYTRFTLSVKERVFSIPDDKWINNVSYLPFVAFGDIARYIVDYGYRNLTIAVTAAAEQSIYKNKQGKTIREISFRVRNAEMYGKPSLTEYLDTGGKVPGADDDREWRSSRWI